MTRMAFTKGHGTENDFVLLFDERGDIDLTPATVRFLCDRRAGIGADGVIRAVRVGALAPGTARAADADHTDGEDPDAWFMDYWNSDGSLSEMCGNGARVFGAFLEAEAGLDLSGGITIITRGGPRTVASLGGGAYSVGMGTWRLGDGASGASAPAAFDSTVQARGLHPARPALSVDVGNPHHVVALASADELEALDLTVAPVVLPAPPRGSNVEFAVTLGGSTVDGRPRGRVRMRVHERGSGETRSCGTGACAVALAVRSWAGPGAPDVWDVEVPGGLVTVRVLGGTTTLEGPAVLVAKGTVEVA